MLTTTLVAELAPEVCARRATREDEVADVVRTLAPAAPPRLAAWP